MRTFRYQDIADSLRQQIDDGEFGSGQLLPSEATLVETYRASRVTIRKALELLRHEELVESRQGFGWMVAAQPLTQSLDQLVTIEQQLAQRGVDSTREIVDFSFVDAPPAVAPVLGPQVLEVRRVHRVNGRPFARVIVWCREDLGAELSRAQVAQSSFYDLVPGPKRASQTIGAALMSEPDADLLNMPVHSATLIVKRTTYGDGSGAILMSEHAFPGHLTEFVAELAGSADDLAPTVGFRLVGGAEA